jgi:diacylglycerol kinase
MNMKSRIAAFKHALSGGRVLILTQPHARFHAVATATVVIAAILCHVTAVEWALLILSISGVWATEAINTGIEFLADEVSLEWRERIKHAKDISAFAVLAVSLGAAAIGAIVFLPYLSNYIGKK